MSATDDWEDWQPNPDSFEDRALEAVAVAIGQAAYERHGRTLMAWAVSPERRDCLAFALAAIQAMAQCEQDKP